MTGLLPFVLILFVVVLLVALARYLGAKRRKELAAWSASRGLRFEPERDGTVESRYPAFNCFRTGHDRYGYNFIRGRWGEREMEAFDYHYETHSTGSKGRRTTQHHHFSAVALGSPVPLKPLFIRPEGFFDKVAEFFGADDIDFESAEFSRRFYVRSPDRKWAYDVLHPRTMEFMLGRPVFTVQFDCDTVVAWRSSTFNAAEFESAADLAAGIMDRLPEYVVQQQTGTGEQEGRC